MTPIDATNCLTLDDLRPLALEEAADDPAILGAVIRYTPGEWDTTMGWLIETTMRDFLDDAPMRVTVEYLMRQAPAPKRLRFLLCDRGVVAGRSLRQEDAIEVEDERFVIPPPAHDLTEFIGVLSLPGDPL